MLKLIKPSSILQDTYNIGIINIIPVRQINFYNRYALLKYNTNVIIDPYELRVSRKLSNHSV